MTSDPVALITGATQGLGRALAGELFRRGWRLVLDGRDQGRLADLSAAIPTAIVVPGDITDPSHRADLAAAVSRLDLYVANASELGPSPLPRLGDHPIAALRRVYETNVIAPVAILQAVLPHLRESGGTFVAISSDAAVEAYEGWGGYGGSKAALDHVAAVLGVEEPDVRSYALDPGDMRTEMHQLAFPGEDISDRPLPDAVVPAVLRLLDARPAGGRYRAADFAIGGAAR
jgi:NAD(P)-dependent dehydrogenase (short-subunit alcohol dehydrogenase family)